MIKFTFKRKVKVNIFLSQASKFAYYQVLVWLIFAVIIAGCANHAAQQVKRAEKMAKKEQKIKEQDYQNLKKRHYQMQTDETKARMKSTEKRFKKYRNQRVNHTFWDRLLCR